MQRHEDQKSTRDTRVESEVSILVSVLIFSDRLEEILSVLLFTSEHHVAHQANSRQKPVHMEITDFQHHITPSIYSTTTSTFVTTFPSVALE